MYKHLLVPTDGTRLSDKAIRTATILAAKLGARLTAIHVVPPYNLAVSGYEIAPVVVGLLIERNLLSYWAWLAAALSGVGLWVWIASQRALRAVEVA